MLRRETAIELPVTPSKLQKTNEQNQEFQISNERRAVSADNPPKISPSTSRNNNMSYLIPDNDQRNHKKPSSDSLHKNSSSDNTDYSAHPYHVIKQNSNDTNSSFNIDNSSFTNDFSLEADTSTTLNSTVIENTAASEIFPKRASTISSGDTSRGNVALLRKQFSIDQHQYGGSSGAISGGNVKRPHSENLEKMFYIGENRSPAVATKFSPRILMNVLKESSSTSTEDTKEDVRKVIPSISTHLVQDEIAKLSLNIKSSTEEDEVSRTVVTDDDNVETMC